MTSDFCLSVAGLTGISGCIPTFTRKENIIVYGGTLAPGANSIDACSSACVAGTDCVGYNYDKTASSSKCYLLTGVVGNENPNNDLDLYTKDDNCALLSTTPVSHFVGLGSEDGVSVKTCFESPTQCLCSMNKIGDGNVVGGKAVDNVNTLPACLAFCIRSETCKAVDFDKTVSQCFWFSAGGLKPSGSSCCEHHQKDCRGVCVDSYNVTVNTGYLGGVEVPQRPSVMDCQNACTESAMCEGFDFNKPVPSCFVLTAGSLNPANARPYSSSDVDHYRRNRCPGGTPGRTTLPTTIRTTLCPARYQRNVNRNARGGTRYPPGTSLPACQDGCTKDENCFALDFDRNANSCFFHKAVPTGLGTAPGVDHYVKIPCPGVTPAPVTPAPVTPAPVTPAPVTPAPVTPAPVTPAPVTPAPVTPTPTACNIDIGFILESSTANTAAVASFQRGVMGLVIGRMNFGRTGFRVSTRRFATTSEKFLTVQTADYYNRADIVGIVRGQSVNAPLGQPGKNVDLAVNGFLNGDTSGRAEVADSLVAIPGVTGTRVNLVVLMTDVNPGTAMDTLLPRVRKVIMVPLTSSLIVPPRFNTIRDIQGRVKLVALPLNTDNNTIANSIISEINLINPLCRDQAASPVPPVVVPPPVVVNVNCHADIAIVLDNRPGKSNMDLILVKRFAHAIVSHLLIGDNYNRVALVTMDNQGNQLFDLDDYKTTDSPLNAINRVTRASTGTNIADGLRVVRQRIFTSFAGDRSSSKNVIILLSRGRDGSDAYGEVSQLQELHVSLVAVGVRGFADEDLLRYLVTAPSQSNYFSIGDLREFNFISQTVTEQACRSVQMPTPAPTQAPTQAPTVVPERCVADLVIVMDTSGSIKDKNVPGQPGNFKQMITFAQDLVDLLEISQSRTRVAAVTFSNYAETNMYLADYDDKPNIKRKLAGLPFQGGNTNTTGGLRQARTDVLIPQRGDRQQTKNIILILSDGMATREVNELPGEVTKIRNSGAHIIGVGITKVVNGSQMRSIVDKDNYLSVENFNQLADLALSVSQLICNAVKT